MRKNLFLYLTLVCFIALVAIFVVDGYMGIYDTIYITYGEQVQTIEPDYWLEQGSMARPEVDQNGYYIYANRDEKIAFRHQVENRRLTRYQVDVEVSVWHSQQKILDLLSQPISLGTFNSAELKWVVDSSQFTPASIPTGQSYQYTIRIRRGDTERRIIVTVGPSLSVPVKPASEITAK